MKNIKIIIVGFMLTGLLITSLPSCTDDLNTEPKGGDTELLPYTKPEAYPQLVAKIYAGFCRIGNTGPDQDRDISEGDGSESSFIRSYFNMQELVADQVKSAWSDEPPLYYSKTIIQPGNRYAYNVYQRCMLTIAFANDFLRNTDPAPIQVDNLDRYRAEVRALRAMNYYFLMDLYGNPGWIDETKPMDGSYLPEQLGRENLFNWIETEFKDILSEGKLLNHSQQAYGLVTVQTAQAMLAKMYLNAEVYTGQARWADCITYCDDVINYNQSLLSLEDNYQNLFCADNDLSKEIIFTLAYDRTYAQDWGGTKFIMGAFSSADMFDIVYLEGADWQGYRATPELVNLFDPADKRALFHATGRTKEMTDILVFTNGYSVAKFTNKGKDGSLAKGVSQFPDTDYPLIRLAEIYLTKAEAQFRSGVGDKGLAAYNAVHAHPRTGVSASTNISESDLLAERGRELYLECQRRTDLIRFKKFTSNYNWTWKGDILTGKDVPSHYTVFPLDPSILSANPNLKQNDGYEK